VRFRVSRLSRLTVRKASIFPVCLVMNLRLRLMDLFRAAPWFYPNSVAYDVEYEA
jgi:hypothetical protein